MKPPPFDYVCADSVADVLGLLDEYGPDASVLAGGQSLVPMLSMRLARPKVVVDITRVGQIGGYRIEDETLTIGAGVRQASVQADRDVGVAVPLLDAVLPWIGHWQTRARGTVVGSIAHADPAGELPLVMLALGGQLYLRSQTRARTVSASDFFVGTMQTCMDDDEFVESIALPAPRQTPAVAFAEFGRRHGDFAIVSCAAVKDGNETTLSVGGVNDVPAKFVFDDAAVRHVDDFINEVARSLDARQDNHATPALRRELVCRLGASVLDKVLRADAPGQDES